MLTAFFTMLLTLLCSITNFAQDHHYTLASLSPLRMNPALSGVFENGFKDKDIRFTSHYRDQWRTVQSDWTSYQTPFITSSLGIDSQIKLHKIVRGDYAGWGIQLLYDKSGDLKLSSSEITFSLAYHKVLNNKHTSYLSLAGSYTYTLRKIDYTEGVFDNQWTGLSFDPNAATGEVFPINQFNFDDFKIGILYQFFPALAPKFNIGYSLHHLNQPRQSFFLADESNKLHFNNIVHGAIEYPLKNKKRSIVSNLFYQGQAKANEVKIAAYYKFKIEDAHAAKKHIQLGIGFREVGSWKKAIDSDAFFVAGRYRVGSAIFSLAYDINISRLNPATNTIGAFEINITYYEDLYRKNKKLRKRLGNYRPKCPEPIR